MTTFSLRRATADDLPLLEKIAAEMKAHHEPHYFARCFNEQDRGARIIFIAGDGTGYAQMIWSPAYAPFRRLDIPEIQDVNVVPGARRRGLGAALVARCEQEARAAGKTDIGIGVGLHASFGAAQRLYVRLGYMPDGGGIVYDEVTVPAGEMRPVDDLLSLKMTKSL